MEPSQVGQGAPPWAGKERLQAKEGGQTGPLQPGRLQALQQPSAASASPFDYVKAGAAAADRRLALGLTPTRLSDSFGGNQSFPRCCVTSQQLARRLESPCLAAGGVLMQSPFQAERGRSTDGLASNSMLGQGGRGSRLLQNPNKAWAIVSADKGQVLINNSILSTMLGYSDKQLRSTRLWDLVVKKGKGQCSMDQMDIDQESGDSLAYSGRVVSLKTAAGEGVTVSLSVRKLVDSTRLMVFMEPVQQTVGYLDLDREGRVLGCDQGAETIFQLSAGDMVGEWVARLIPSLQLPREEVGSRMKQAVTGRLDQEIYFPLSCIVTRQEGGGCRAAVWVYSCLSGLLILDSEGRVTEADSSFSNLVLGYNITGVRVEQVIPGFYDEFEVPSVGDRTDDESLGCEDMGDRNSEASPLEEINLNVGMAGCSIQSPARGAAKPSLPGSPVVRRGGVEDEDKEEKENLRDSVLDLPDSSPVFKRPSSLHYSGVGGQQQHRTPVKVAMELLTSTPASGARKQGDRGAGWRAKERSIEDGPGLMPTGCFYGLARHKTGSDISVLYQVKRVVLQSGETIYCVWVTRDSEERSQVALLTLATTLETSQFEQSEACTDTSIESLTAGEYGQKYVTLHQVGQGAFGCVKLAYREEDKLLVVTKFITKAKVPQDNWVDGDREGEMIPFEASLLCAIKHRNIVCVLDMFQNSTTVQLVMAKHGDMDLFEFIDRNPVMEEGLASLIFRQVVSAVHFLHSKEILHRDIKDENVIIDYNFNCKLIDFGSATFFKPEQLFSTFYGTVEYCSPEVLQGRPYAGPELEAWSLGVLLYIVMFGENPFYDPADTVRAQLHPPHNDVSPQCMELLESCLEPEPSRRASLWYIKEHDWVTMPGVSNCDYSLSEVIPCTESERKPATHFQEREVCSQLYSQGGSMESGARTGEFSSLESNKDEERNKEIVTSEGRKEDGPLESSREYSTLDTSVQETSIDISKQYSNLLTTAELDELEYRDESSVEYSNLESTQELVEEDV